MHYLDDRPLWTRDIWQLKDFQEKFDFEYHKSYPQGFIRVDSIKNTKLFLKEYISYIISQTARKLVYRAKLR